MFNERIDAVQFVRNLDALRAVGNTLSATDAVVCLTDFRHGTVVAYQIGTARLFVVLVLAAPRHIAFVDTFVVVEQNGRNVDTVRAGHAVFAIVARHGRVFLDKLSRFFQKFIVLVGQRHKRRVGAEIVLQVFHIGHAAQYGEHLFRRTGKTERP